jgi:L-histidine N-alpha-methyltransferase
MLTEGITTHPLNSFASEVRAGLTKEGQKELPSKYFYDEVGSALFEVISVLPEYGLTRADTRILRRYARDIVDRMALPVIVAELGSGTGKKTRWILEALSSRQNTTYYPIEMSRTALARCELELGRIDCVSIVGFEREYLDGLLEVSARRHPGEQLLVLFLGSTIGNFDRPAAMQFLRSIRETLREGDALLLGTDLQSSVPELIRAYDDSLGVTAAFNLNLLARINRELDANFVLSQFRHAVKYDPGAHRVEMHLRSAVEQTVSVSRADLTVTFEKDETIWTESSHKFTCEGTVALAERSGFKCDAQWVDREWPFAQSLLVAA